ncbi:dicarboxylate/amino acid:cation symporter [Clostridium sp. CF012]|uniref:dicarboxylate/amino acid:cation symporter n=1 Tax=Clostridium sp. CF012 TaxID=2843319 RepID=UPI001C0BECC1|nr:dicarboxylate/amino acid:cation symporter [Clostridium sp. CF012]MBU3144879.1 dicarboxylate/amino acid:cation symporter [Clostridium sp. CF012]
MKFKKVNMTVQIMIAMVLGVIVGTLAEGKIEGIKLLGDIFLRLIQMSIILLVMGQIIEAIGSLNPKELGKQGVKIILIFLGSSFIAASFGIFIAIMLKPGVGINLKSLTSGVKIDSSYMGSISDTVLGFFSTNVIKSMADGAIAQVIIFAILFGVALSYVRMENENIKLLGVIIEFNKIILRMISNIMKIAPIGIFSLIASTIGKVGVGVILPLSKYLATYALGTFIYLIISFVIVSIYCKIEITKLIKGMMQMSLMALATTSSAVTLPTEMKDAREKLGISERVTKLVLPLGMTLNSNGSGMHMAFTIVTIAQIYGVRYSGGQYLYIAALATLVSLANAVVPGGGLVSLAIIVPQMGLPIEAIALFAGVEWFVGMLRTILNVDSDTFTALIIAKGQNEIDYTVYK